MFTIRGLRRCRTAALAIFATTLLAGAPSAGAVGYGELTHFGSKGTGHVQFTEHGPQAVAFGADPTDKSLYVADEPEEHVFRIQKLSYTGEYEAAVSLKVKGAGPEPESGLEGIAVDPVEGRIYVLAVQSRGDEEHAIVDPETLAAGAIYAFSTTPKEGKLEPATGTKEGLLASAAVLHAQSKELGQALLEPSGITVDPTTHDIILMGNEDEGEGKEPATRVALERVSSNGVLGARWSDNATEAFFASEEASSPAVSKEGKVYVLGEVEGAEHPEQIDEIPASFSSATKPTPLVAFDSGPNELVTFPGEPKPLQGGGMSIAPDGTIYVYAKVHQESNGKIVPNPGALAFSGAGVELGWTGGQSTQLGLGHCTVSFLGHPTVAAGGEQRVFMFDSNPEAPSVISFGPGGTGCPVAKSSAIAATVLGAPVESVKPGTEVKFVSTVTEANALSVKWTFGDGAELETGNKHQTPEAGHTFATEGEFKVKETIQTDNLNNPELVQEKTIVVKSSVPIAKFTTENVTVGQPSEFNAKASTGSEKSAVTSYKWDFGDGSTPVVTSEPTISHTYAAAGEYTVKLIVEDALKRVSAGATQTVFVAAKEESKPPAKEEAPPAIRSTSTTTPPPPPPSGGVLAFRASLLGTSLLVTKSGSFGLKVDCAGQSICVGTVTLRTLGAVSAAKKKSILTLASGSFSLSGGQVKTVALHLSSKAKALLARSHTLKAKVTILARDSQNASHTMAFTVTLRPAKTKRGH
ncbi:MAG TPA: PKD domain-containing protein [Solirubrobacteraceae bacterium]